MARGGDKNGGTEDGRNGGSSNPHADPMFPPPDPADLEADYRRKARDGRSLGNEFAADLLERYLDGSGEDLTIPAEQMRAKKPVKEAEDVNKHRIEDSFTLEEDKDGKKKPIPEALKKLKDGETIQLPDRFGATIKGNDLLGRGEIDLYLAT